ncbi:hypothetical protein E4U59_001156 [Claviceps monticola]|nr:hypothetical protein E4U59_001156 [Claviceps monticola]
MTVCYIIKSQYAKRIRSLFVLDGAPRSYVRKPAISSLQEQVTTERRDTIWTNKMLTSVTSRFAPSVDELCTLWANVWALDSVRLSPRARHQPSRMMNPVLPPKSSEDMSQFRLTSYTFGHE